MNTSATQEYCEFVDKFAQDNGIQSRAVGEGVRALAVDGSGYVPVQNGGIETLQVRDRLPQLLQSRCEAALALLRASVGQ